MRPRAVACLSKVGGGTGGVNAEREKKGKHHELDQARHRHDPAVAELGERQQFETLSASVRRHLNQSLDNGFDRYDGAAVSLWLEVALRDAEHMVEMYEALWTVLEESRSGRPFRGLRDEGGALDVVH